LVFFAKQRLIKEGFKKEDLEGFEVSPLDVNYRGTLDILRIGDTYIIKSASNRFKLSMAVNGNWTVNDNYVRTEVPDVSDEAPELRIYKI
jgi:hypothetical protein